MKLLHERTYETIGQSTTDSPIGAQKDKSVRNHILVLNTIICDVLSSKKKAAIDLNIMDYKQMFDAKEVPICLNALYDSGVKNDIFAFICEANKTATFVVKTPSGNTETQVIYNKIMQGDVLAPLVSSNMVDRHIGRKAFETRNTYFYKNKVDNPPLAMQDDTLGISECGFKTKAMKEFLNYWTNLINLQYGSKKCVKMHVGRTHEEDICSDLSVDEWKENVYDTENGKKNI